jgi:hypothetical protein
LPIDVSYVTEPAELVGVGVGDVVGGGAPAPASAAVFESVAELFPTALLQATTKMESAAAATRPLTNEVFNTKRIPPTPRKMPILTHG